MSEAKIQSTLSRIISSPWYVVFAVTFNVVYWAWAATRIDFVGTLLTIGAASIAATLLVGLSGHGLAIYLRQWQEQKRTK